MLWHRTNTYLYGMKILEWIILTQKRKWHTGKQSGCELCDQTDCHIGSQKLSFHRYIELVRKHGLEISQPALEPSKKLTWRMTMRLFNSEVHR